MLLAACLAVAVAGAGAGQAAAPPDRGAPAGCPHVASTGPPAPPARGAPEDSAAPAAPRRAPAADLARFLAGGALGLGMHEAGHIGTAAIVGASPGVKKVTFGAVRFFAITHREVPHGREYAIAASGFWVQHATSEWLLSRRPALRHQRAPVAKGVLAFNVLTSLTYASAAFGRFGPHERDTRAMAEALGVQEPVAGALIAAPAVLDAWRYFSPRSRWAVWASRAMKVGVALAVAGSR